MCRTNNEKNLFKYPIFLPLRTFRAVYKISLFLENWWTFFKQTIDVLESFLNVCVNLISVRKEPTVEYNMFVVEDATFTCLVKYEMKRSCSGGKRKGTEIILFSEISFCYQFHSEIVVNLRFGQYKWSRGGGDYWMAKNAASWSPGQKKTCQQWIYINILFSTWFARPGEQINCLFTWKHHSEVESYWN